MIKRVRLRLLRDFNNIKPNGPVRNPIIFAMCLTMWILSFVNS
jgi:hypothetical protein